MFILPAHAAPFQLTAAAPAAATWWAPLRLPLALIASLVLLALVRAVLVASFRRFSSALPVAVLEKGVPVKDTKSSSWLPAYFSASTSTPSPSPPPPAPASDAPARPTPAPSTAALAPPASRGRPAARAGPVRRPEPTLSAHHLSVEAPRTSLVSCDEVENADVGMGCCSTGAVRMRDARVDGEDDYEPALSRARRSRWRLAVERRRRRYALICVVGAATSTAVSVCPLQLRLIVRPMPTFCGGSGLPWGLGVSSPLGLRSSLALFLVFASAKNFASHFALAALRCVATRIGRGLQHMQHATPHCRVLHGAFVVPTLPSLLPPPLFSFACAPRRLLPLVGPRPRLAFLTSPSPSPSPLPDDDALLHCRTATASAPPHTAPHRMAPSIKSISFWSDGMPLMECGIFPCGRGGRYGCTNGVVASTVTRGDLTYQ
ncbi:hypothetical protein C8R46DRAFT_1048095 [Mycena filopes]|nr:hypothetical protein C8R46DRAFT_1048095 [Mycena filopes]